MRAHPRGGLYNRAQQVTLEGPNDDDNFFYTLDGTELTTASQRYAGPIGLDRTATLSVIGVNSAGEQGQIRTFTYTIDPDADLERPVITLSHQGGTYADPFEVVFTVCPRLSMWRETPRTDWPARRYPSPQPGGGFW